ncbi:hypothetical protein J2W59_002424 [Pseudomonas fluorescens]|nr:hypothetical protein [Pseudomonas fluorescens]
MVQRGYPGIHAGMPTPQCLCSGTPSLGEVPSGGAKRFWLLLALFQK